MNWGCISHAEVPAFQGTILCFSYFWQSIVGIYTWLDLRLLLTPYPFCSGFIKHYFFKFLGNLVAKYWRVVSLASRWIIIGIIATVSAGLLLFFAWFLYIMYFPCGTDQLIYTFFSGILEKNPILSPCISLMLILLYENILVEYEFQNQFCRMLGFPPRSPEGYRALPTHPYLLVITSDWTVALETVVMLKVISLWLNEGKKIEQKSTFLFQHATWKLKLSHIHSLYFRALFGNGTDLSC